jgi:6-phosphogluconolactonase (cycloisomerase 2 family)
VEFQADGVTPPDSLDAPSDFVASQDNNHLYVAANVDDAVTAFSRSSATESITVIEAQRNGQNGVDGLEGARSMALTGDGRHLYVAGYNDDAVAIFSRDAATGGLTWVDVRRDGVDGVDGINGATAVAVSPDDGHVYVVGNVDDAVAVFEISDGISPAAKIIPAITPILFDD